MKIRLYFITIFCMLAVSCHFNKNTTSCQLKEYENKICDSLNYDPEIIRQIRLYDTSRIEYFHYSMSKMYSNGQETELDPIYLPAIVFTIPNIKSYDLVFKLKNYFREKGYTIFLLENNFNIQNKPDYIAVLKTIDKYEILKQIGCSGTNYNINTDSLIAIIKDFDELYSLELIGASGDWCEFVINNLPDNCLAFAKDIYRVCPDVVEQGVESVEALATEIKNTKRLYLWWD